MSPYSTPGLSIADLGYGCPVHAKRGCNLVNNVAICQAFANLPYLFMVKFCIWVAYARDIARPTFGMHISHIIQRGAQKKMVWAYASAVIAFMEHVKALGYFSVVDLPRNSMRHIVASLAPAKAHLPISCFELGCGPIPAMLGLFNFCPKSFFKRISHGELYTA